MKYIVFLFVSYLILINTGCIAHSSPKQLNNEGWVTLTIVSEENTVITINNNDDTSIVKIHNVGTIFSRPQKVTTDLRKVYFTRAEKDTLVYLAGQIIINHVKNTRKCTDFVGDLALTIDYDGFKQHGEYSGVCDWNALSPDTRHLHAILKRRLKNIYLGEDNARLK